MDVNSGYGSPNRKSKFTLFQITIQIVKFTLFGIVVLTCLFAVNHVKLSSYFPIKQVRVYGADHVDHQELQNLLLPLVNHGFFAIDVDDIRDRLRQLSWVANVYVKRAWPDEVDVLLREKRPVASWNDETLLSDNGELFSPEQETYPSNLPRLVGPEGRQIIMLDNFLQINRLLNPLHVKISYLELSAYDSWKLTLDNGIVLQVGYKDILTRIEHFVKVYPKIVGARFAEVEYIDLRYSNGLAVRWKAPVKG